VEKIPGGFDQYKDEVMRSLEERQEAIERTAAKRAENRKADRERRKAGGISGKAAAKLAEEEQKKADEAEKNKPAIDFGALVGKKKKKKKKDDGKSPDFDAA